MLEEMGIATGVDIEGLFALRAELERWLPNEVLHGSLARAGLPKTFTGPSSNDFTAGVQ